jgi:exosome complex RNA-binding protein Rrp42 (RNase PH superfamily)
MNLAFAKHCRTLKRRKGEDSTMQTLLDSRTPSTEGSADAVTANEEIGKNLTTWLNLIQMAVSHLDNPNESVVDAHWNQGRRPDGRSFSQSRPYQIQRGALTPSLSAFHGNSSSDVVGSAMVRMGPPCSYRTIVLASVTTQVGQPAMAAPKQGDVLVLVSSCNGVASSNNHMLQSLQSFLQRTLEENMDLEQLLLDEGKMAYRLIINISVLQDHSSSLFMAPLDVCLAAAVSALLDTKLPSQPLIKDGIVYAYESMYGVETKPLNMPIIPCALTAIQWHREADERESNGDTIWIVDPDLSEQQVQASLATVVVSAKFSASDVSLLQRSLLSVHFAPSTFNTTSRTSFTSSFTAAPGVTASELSQLIHLAVEHAEALYPNLLPSSQQVSSMS